MQSNEGKVYAISEIVGASKDGIEAAIAEGLRRADTTLRNLEWFEVTEIRGNITDGKVGYYQVGLKIGFRLEG